MDTVSKLTKELDIGRTQIVSSEYSRTKHVNEINNVLKELKTEQKRDLTVERNLEEEARENAS